MVLIPKPTCGVAAALAFGLDNLVQHKAADDIVAAFVRTWADLRTWIFMKSVYNSVKSTSKLEKGEEI